MTVSRYRARKQRVLRSVFQTDLSQPTPRSTPVAPFTQPGAAFGGPVPHASSPSSSPSSSSGPSAAGQQPAAGTILGGAAPPPPHPTTALHQTNNDQVRWDRAWHAVISRIQLPSSVTVEDSFGTLAPESQEPDLDADFVNSLPLVLNPSRALPQATQTEDILLWHTQQVRQHFVHRVMPLLAACSTQGDRPQVLLSSISTLEAAHRQYLYGLRLIARGIGDEATEAAATAKFIRDLHAIIGNSMTQGLIDTLRGVVHQLVRMILGSSRRYDGELASLDLDDSERVSTARGELLGLLESLRNVGLTGENFQVQFAESMNATMAEFIYNSYSGVWQKTEPTSTTSATVLSGCLSHLSEWVENHYSRLAVEVFNRLGSQIAWSNVECWKDIAIGRLASLRIQELFDIAINWPESKGGLEDLRLAVTTPQRRLQLTDAFSLALQKRLLHPGRSTLDILQTYISMIRTFHALDPSKVLLDRVVHALQLYLCQRDDAIRIVVIGLLSNPSTTTPEEGKSELVELAVLLNNSSQQQRRQMDDEDLDWNDMTWIPDPVDAGVNYKRPKNEDVIGTLINALGSQDIFIKEFQHIIAERLLSNQASFIQEIKVLSLLKKRFGENALQNCDVMMKDIQDSKRVDSTLCKNIRLALNPEAGNVTYHSKILSRLFWPSLSKDPFQVPPPVAEIQKQYEQGFEELKTSRKLTWLDNLGLATVKLDLEDRSIELECKAYEAAVIYEFQATKGSNDPNPQRRTFNEIWEKLMIDEDLLELALRFWVGKRVLHDVGDQTYAVVERLDDTNATDQPEDPTSAKGAEDQPSPRKTKNIDAKEKERRTVHWQFIVGMLTNSAPAMPLGQIAMMMKMLMADGCPWSNEELREFLEEKVADNELELVGGKYRLPKK